MTTFIDKIVISQKHHDSDQIKEVAGLRSLGARFPGDINRDGARVLETEYLPVQVRAAWVHGSHNTKIQLKSADGLVLLAGNPGRYGRPDNLFNLDLPDTIAMCNRLAAAEGLPGFSAGEPIGSGRMSEILTASGLVMATGGSLKPDDYVIVREDGTYRQAARVWEIHVTRNFVTGNQSNAGSVIRYLDTQSMARVKKGRYGSSTITWGSLKYCQVEAYNKADEMMAHCTGEIERLMMAQNPAYIWARDNGVVRIEVKAAKDCLRDKGLTYLGAWTMENVIQLFDERTEVLHRVKCQIEEFDPSMLPSGLACTAEAWLKGSDVKLLLSRATFFRHAKQLREFGIDIADKRNVTAMPVRWKYIDIVEAHTPDWYSFESKPLQLVA